GNSRCKRAILSNLLLHDMPVREYRYRGRQGERALYASWRPSAYPVVCCHRSALRHKEKATRRWPFVKHPGGGPEAVRSELVHGVVFTAGFQSCFTSEVLFMVVTDVGASHVLVLDAGDT